MKNATLTLFLCLCYLGSFAQLDNQIVIGKIDSIDSKILNEQRKVWVYVPDAHTNSIYLKKNYPVIYLLDGDSHFYSVVGMIQQLSSVNGNTIVPKMIVVGITNTNRTRDLTPTKAELDPPFTDSMMVANSGGGAKFLSFIENELIPKIDAEYPTEPYRMFIGHSFGGLTVMNTLVHKPHLFNSYVSIDPSMAWSNQRLLKEIKSTSFDSKYRDKALFLGIANTMEKGMDTLSVQQDTTKMNTHIRSILEVNNYLKNNTKSQLSYKGHYYKDDSHGSVPLITTYDALRFIFDFYQLELGMDDFMNPDSNLLEKVVNHYKKVSKTFGSDAKPEEDFVNGLGYEFLGMGQYDKAEAFFKLNITNYPESFNVYDSLGDFYAAKGENVKAIENYKKSISLNKDSFSKPKLEALEKE